MNDYYPWQHPDLIQWSIVGMNHYHQSGERMLFVAMTHDSTCITAEGPDDKQIWIKLADAARFHARPRPAFYDMSHQPGDGA